MSSQPSSPTPAASSTPLPTSTIPSRPQSPELPLTMATSLILTSLPYDASTALSLAGTFPSLKVTVNFKPVGSAPLLNKPTVTISSTQRFETVVGWLRKKLRVGEKESVFLYVNSSFAPSLDEVVGNLHRCFKDGNDRLVITYSMTPAFG